MANFQTLDGERLLQALKALEEAVFVEYGMISEPKPMTAKALREARTLMRESCRLASRAS